jgi:hypothetical protein
MLYVRYDKKQPIPRGIGRFLRKASDSFQADTTSLVNTREAWEASR